MALSLRKKIGVTSTLIRFKVGENVIHAAVYPTLRFMEVYSPSEAIELVDDKDSVGVVVE